MRIVITGALGHIGSKLIHQLPKYFNYPEIIIIDNFFTQRYCSLFELPKTAKYQFYNKDIMKEDITKFFKNADVVIHLAAITNAADSFNNAQEVEKINFEGTKKIADICSQLDIPLLFPSTTSVYGTQNTVVDENCTLEELKPQSPYAESKLKAENYLKELGRVQQLKFITCRFGTIYGTSIGMRFHTAINKFCYQAAMNEPVTVWKTAMNQVRPYLELQDAVESIVFILKNKLFNNETYNILSDNHSISEIVDIIRKIKPELRVHFVENKIMNQLSYHVSVDKFKKNGFIFKGKLEDVIFETLKMFQSIQNSILE